MECHLSLEGLVIVAYLLLVHANLKQVTRLISALPEESPVFIHVDTNAGRFYEELRDAMKRRAKTYFVPRFRSRWASPGISRATFSLINAAIESGVEFDYATLLSGADYPIKSNEQIADFLARAKGNEFIESFAMEKPNRWTEMGGLYKAPDRALRYHLRIRGRVYNTPITRSMPYGLVAYGGSQWWTLTRAAVEYIDVFHQKSPKFDRFLHGTFIPDEFVVQTILSNSPFAGRIVGDDLRFAIWDRPVPPYPATLKCADVPELLASTKLFARKFSDSVDSDVLDHLDAAIGNKVVAA
ncbi:beta-1,6-N-acetylglucosaminyltransferase [Rhizobium sp. AC44/96]|uniref:beta-1,6-N-acetylglucosaminyltransferase n=1 Tax=Rhizobium sp. AC44/96 TaxID=1841654 RepID=UPI0009F52D70|nr:beta-1,6-N-acetylglucosaminyltransferase [Rhizobium sp. AC44/96]